MWILLAYNVQKTYEFCKTCEKCQKLGSITKRNMIHLNLILEIEIFDYWGIDFMGPFPSSFEFVYILVAVDHKTPIPLRISTIPNREISAIPNFLSYKTTL